MDLPCAWFDIVYLLLSTLSFLIGIALITFLHSRHRLDVVVRPGTAPSPAPLVSVIVPARNEARNIRACVESLFSQTYPNLEFIVVDDRSTDATPVILHRLARRDPRLRIVHGTDLPPGWVGKPHALWQGYNVSRGEWLCFVDADTVLAPQAVATCLAQSLEHRADLYTILTDQEMVTFWERTLLPLIMTAISVAYPPTRVNDPKRREAIANGQFILIRREVYERVGGHAAIRDSIVEDRDLARRVKDAGYRLLLADGRAVARTRMYTSLPEMWEGWTKNVFLGLKSEPRLLPLGVLGALIAPLSMLALPLWFLAGALWGLGLLPWDVGPAWVGGVVAAQAAGVFLYLLVWRALAARAMRVPARYALTTPLGLLVIAAIILVSAYRVLTGKGVIWKGRLYRAGRG